MSNYCSIHKCRKDEIVNMLLCRRCEIERREKGEETRPIIDIFDIDKLDSETYHKIERWWLGLLTGGV